MMATTITPVGGDRYQRGCVDVTKDDVNISGARRQIKKIITRNNNSGGCMDGNTNSSMTVVELSSLANDNSLIAATAVVTPSSHDPDNDNGYTTINDDGDDYSTAHYSPLPPSCSTNRMTITNQKPYISLTQQHQQPPLTRTPWNQKIQMTPITMALTTASSSSTTPTTPPSFLFYHGDITVDSIICDDSNEIKQFNVSNGVELVDDDLVDDCDDEANTITTSSPMTTPRTNDYDMKYNSPFKSYMTILDERLDSVTKELHRLDCRIEQCYSNDDDDDDDYNDEKEIYNDLYGNEDEMSKYYCYLVDDNVVDDRNDCHRAAVVVVVGVVVEETIINVTNDEQHECCHHGNEIMSDEDENDKENIVPNSLYNNPRSDSIGSDSKSVDGDSTCKKIIHRRHPMSDREVNIVNSCHSSSDQSHRLPLQQMSCQPHQQEHINCVIGDTPFDSCGTEVRRVLWKEGAFTPCDSSNDDEVPIQLFPTARSISDEIQQVTKECEIVTKEHDQLLNLVVELQQLRREDTATNMQLQREFQLSLVEIDQLRSELNNQETVFREDNEHLSSDMEMTPTKKLTSADTLNQDTTVRLRENIKVLELRNSKLVSEVEQLTSSLNVVTEHNKVLHTRIEDDSAAYNELLQDNSVTEEEQSRLLNVVNDLTLSYNTERLDYEKKIDSLRTLLEVEKTANTTIVKNLKRTCNDVMFQTESLEGSIDHVNSLQKKLSLLLDSQAENESLSVQLLDLRKSDEVKGQEIKVMQQQFEVVRAQRDELFGKSAKLKKSLTRSIQLLEMSKDRESQIMSLNESIVTLRTKLSYKDTRLQELEQQQTDSSDRDSQDSLMEKAAHFQHLAAKLAISLLQLRIKWKQSNEYNLVAQLAAQNEKVATLERCVDGVTADRHALAITHFRLHEKVTATAAEIAAEEKAQLNSQIRSLSEKIMDQDDELQLLRAREMNQAEKLIENDQLLEENSCIVRELDRKINEKKRDSRAVNCSAVDSKESSVAYYRDSLEMATPVSADVKTLLDHIHKLESQLESSVVEVDVVKETIKSHEATIFDLRNRIISLNKQNASREGQLSSLLSRVDIYVSERDGLALQLDMSVMELNCVREERNELASLLKDAETSIEEKMCIEVKHLRVGLAKSQEELATTKRDCHVIHRQSMALKDIVGKAKILLEKSDNENNRLQYELDNALHAAMKETQEDSSRTPHVAFIEQFNNIRPVAKRGNNELTMLAIRQSTDTGAIIDLDDRQQAFSNNNCVNNVPPKVSSIFMKKGLSMFDLLKDTHKSGRKDNMKYRN